MAATLVQSGTNSTTGAASVAVGSGQGWGAPTAGNLIVAFANGDTTTATPTGFTIDESVVDGNGVYLFYKVADGSETTVTFTLGTSASPVAVGLIEYSGMAASPADVHSNSSIPNSAGTTTTSVSITGTGTTGDLFVAVAGLHGNGSPTTPAWTNSFTNRLAVSAGTAASVSYCQTFVGDFQNTSAGAASTSCSWTGAIPDRQELLGAFKLGAAAPAEIPMIVMPRSA